jgi:hypothetical protein
MISGSTNNSEFTLYSMPWAYKRTELNVLVHEFLSQHGKTREDIINTFRDSFNRKNSLIKENDKQSQTRPSGSF